MKYRIFSLFVLLLLAGSLSAKELRVAAGETLLITPAQQTLRLDALVLGDAAQIRFAPGVTHWQVTAARVQVGDKVSIDARGVAGAVGKSGEDAVGGARECQDGDAGSAGGGGLAGASGIDISLSWGIVELGSLQIVSDGGAGGPGGSGGKGQQGGDIDKCRGGNGGVGGAGGAGGSGGDAGNLSLVYWPVGNQLDATTITRRITVSSVGGEPGGGGAGGGGGAAVEGRYMKGNFAGNKKWLAGGEPGRAGADGEAGKSGREQTPRLQQDFAKAGQGPVSASLPAAINDATVGLSQRVQQLETRLKALESRLRELEQTPR